MRCGRVRRYLNAYLDGELHAQRRSQAEAHLESCAECRAQLARLKELASLLESTSAPAAPSGFAGRVMSRAQQRLVDAASRSLPSLNPVHWWLTQSLPVRAAAAAILVVGLTLGLLMGRDTWSSAGTETAKQAGVDPAVLYNVDRQGASQAESLPQVFLTMVSGSNGREE